MPPTTAHTTPPTSSHTRTGAATSPRAKSPAPRRPSGTARGTASTAATRLAVDLGDYFTWSVRGALVQSFERSLKDDRALHGQPKIELVVEDRDGNNDAKVWMTAAEARRVARMLEVLASDLEQFGGVKRD